MSVQIRAKHAFTANNKDELSFKKKEVLFLVNKLSNRGWWEAKNDKGQVGLVPSNYFDAPPQEVAAPVAPVTPVAPAAAKPLPPTNVPSQVPVAAVKSEEKPQAEKAVEKGAGDPFDLENWAKEMEELLLSSPASSSRKQEPPAQPKTAPSVAAVSAPKAAIPVAAPTKPTPAPPVEPQPVVEAKKEEPVANSEWIVWMQRAIAAEKNVADLVKAAEDDKALAARKLEESNAKAEDFERQVMGLIDRVGQERQDMERQHDRAVAELRGEIKGLEAKVAAMGQGAGAEAELVAQQERRIAELTSQLEESAKEKEDLIASIEADVKQFNDLLEEEREKHREAVIKATELHETYESARERIAVLEEGAVAAQAEIEERDAEVAHLRQEIERMREDFARQLAEAQAKVGEKDQEKKKLSELQQEIEKEKGEKEQLKNELTFLQKMLESRNTNRASLALVRESGPTLQPAPPPPAPPREEELVSATTAKIEALKKKSEGNASTSSSASATTSASSASGRSSGRPADESKKISEAVAAELARQRAQRLKDSQAQQSPKVTSVISGIRSDEKPATTATPATTSAAATTTSTGAGGVSQSRANEILLRAKALAAKAKQQTDEAQSK